MRYVLLATVSVLLMAAATGYVPSAVYVSAPHDAGYTEGCGSTYRIEIEAKNPSVMHCCVGGSWVTCTPSGGGGGATTIRAVTPLAATDAAVPTISLNACGQHQMLVSGDGGWGCENSPGLSTQKYRSLIPLSTNRATAFSQPVSVGIYSFDPDNYTISGLTKTIYFDVVANLSNATSGGTVELYNLTTSAVAATLTFTENSPTAKSSAALALASGMYEARFYTTSGTAMFILSWSGIRVDNTF